MNESQERNYRFDNLKGVLIFVIVFVHIIQLFDTSIENNTILFSVYTLLFSFAMPTFCFISGFFTKTIKTGEKWGRKLVSSTLIPFLIFHFIYWAIFSRNITSLFTPQYALWYLLSLFYWRLLVVPVSRIKFSFIFVICASLLIGVTSADKLLSIQRTISFFPFFIAGVLAQRLELKKSWLKKIARVLPWICLLITISLSIIFSVFLKINLIRAMNYFYSSSGFRTLEGLGLRAIALLLGFCGICWTISFIPNKKTFLSLLGKRSIMIYVLHPYIIQGLKYLNIQVFSQTFLSLLVAFAIAVVACVLFGNQYIEKLYNFCLGKIVSFIVKQESQ